MKTYSKYINPYMEMILENKVEHCLDQEEMIKNIVIPVLERDDVIIDEKKIEEGLTYQKYFPFDLIEWEIFLFSLIVGVFLKVDNRLDNFFKVIRIYVGRGSGKNGFIAFLSFYFMTPAHGIRGYNIDLIANTEKQSKVSFEDVYEVINNPDDDAHVDVLKKHFYCTKEIITHRITKSKLRFNTSNARGKDSKRTGVAIFDEKHEYLTIDVVNSLKSGLGKTPMDREITISTDGHVRGLVFDKEKENSKDILREYDPKNRTLVFWCRIENEKEGMDPTKWIKANPSINDLHTIREIITREAEDMNSNMDYYPEFMAKRMNFPVGNKDIEVASWDDILATNQPMIDLKGMECIGAVDYANTNDFVACVLIFHKNEKYYVLQQTFVCARSRDLPGIKAPLKEWEDKGDIEFIDDVEIPADLVIDWFANQMSLYRIRMICLDSYRYNLLMRSFTKIGFSWEKKNIFLTRPSDLEKASPVINSAFVNHNMVWGDVPIMRWYTNNTKKVLRGLNIGYGKIEPNYRKTDGFMALASGMTKVDLIIKQDRGRNVRRMGTIVG